MANFVARQLPRGEAAGQHINAFADTGCIALTAFSDGIYAMGAAPDGHRPRRREAVLPVRGRASAPLRPRRRDALPERVPPDAFTQAVHPFTTMMVGVARRILGDEVQAWDAVQEALIGLWHQGAIPPNPRAWLARAVVLRSLHQARSRTRRRRHELRACEFRREASDRDEPSRLLQCRELSRSLDDAFRGLPTEYRDVILLRSAANMDYAAIAEVLDVPVGTVRSRLNRARLLFRDALNQASGASEETNLA